MKSTVKRSIMVAITLLMLVHFEMAYPHHVSVVEEVPAGLLLESPQWSVEEQALYFVDNYGQTVYRYEPETGNLTSKHINGGLVTMVLLVKNFPKLLLVTVHNSVYFLNWDTYKEEKDLRQIAVVDVGLPDNNINDGKVDHLGRMWFGTFGKVGANAKVVPDQGTLYMLEGERSAQPLIKVRPVSFSNGMDWSPDNKKLYYIDSDTRRVDVFDYVLETGEIQNRTGLFNFNDYDIPGFPDGMTVDCEGNLWVACFGGGQVVKVDCNGHLLEKIKIPADDVSSVMFGGRYLDTLYVTSGRYYNTDEEIARNPDNGRLFAVTGTGCRGREQHQFVFKNAANY